MKPFAVATAIVLAPVLAASGAVAAEVDYRCSGIGQDRTVEEANFAHSLKLVYAEPDGSYLGDIHTKITDKDGTTVIDTTCEGPWLLVALPGGSYAVEATFEGQSKTLEASVPDNGSAGERVVTFSP